MVSILALSVTYGATLFPFWHFVPPPPAGGVCQRERPWQRDGLCVDCHKGSHFEERLPPTGGRCRAATKGGIWRTNVSLRGRAR